MDICLPHFHDLSRFDEESKAKELYLRKWEISVPCTDSLEWSVVMAHLFTVHFGKNDNFQTKLLELSDQLNSLENIQKCVKSYNPFLNRYSCFHCKELQAVTNDFKEKLRNKMAKSNSDSDDAKLEQASLMLKSSITLITINGDGELEPFVKFPRTNTHTGFETHKTLYCRKNLCSKRYYFGMKNAKGMELKKAAFSRNLKHAGLKPKIINNLYSLYEPGESFVISALKSREDHRNHLLNVYKYPYHTWKLVEAGFEMDPRVVDANGISGLCYAMATGDENLLYALYIYAANACHTTENTFRDPNLFILKNLQELKTILENDRIKSDNYTELTDICAFLKDHLKSRENRDNFRNISTQIMRFNDFLLSVCTKILEQKGMMNNCYNSTVAFNENNLVDENSTANKAYNNKEHEAAMRKNVMLALLKTYNSFAFIDEDEKSKYNLFLLQYYCEYESYYKYVDNSASLFFFDHIFELKERLNLKHDEYSKLESSFFLTVLSKSHFSKKSLGGNLFEDLSSVEFSRNSNKKLKDNLSKPEYNYFKFIPLLERFHLRKSIKKFIKVLNETCIPGNTLNYISDEEVRKSLENVPEVKDEIFICRLVYYIQTAVKQGNDIENIEEIGIKQCLIIERALQVLGETLNYGSQNKTSICFLLYLSVTKKDFQIIKQTRDILSHLETVTFRTPKFEAESNPALFLDILKDIRFIFESMKDIFHFQQFRMADFILNRGMQRIKENLISPGCSDVTFSTEELSKAIIYIQEEHRKVPFPIFSNTLKRFDEIKHFVSETDEMFELGNLWTDETVSGNVNKIISPLRNLLPFVVKDVTTLHTIIVKIDEISEDMINDTPQKVKERLHELWKTCKFEIQNISQNADKINVTTIDIFKRIVKGLGYVTPKEIDCIKSKIPECVKNSGLLKQQIMHHLESENLPSREHVSKLFFSNKDLKTLDKKLKMQEFLLKNNKEVEKEDLDEIRSLINKAVDPIEDLNSILNGTCKHMKKETLHTMCKRLQFPDDIEKQLFEIGRKRDIKENPLDVLLNRIKCMREILIEEDPNIMDLWNNALHVRTKQYADYKISQRYVQDPEIQSSVEMLLFDCMNLLCDKNGIDLLWKKSSSLFSGINLRNVLGHGNPTFETIGKLLDPDDLPSVLVNEMLQLIRDEELIHSVKEFCSKTSSNFDKFVKHIEDGDLAEHAEIRQKIVDNARWKRYAMLLKRSSESIQEK